MGWFLGGFVVGVAVSIAAEYNTKPIWVSC